MANLKQVTPTLIGQTQTAQRSVRMVSVPNAMEGAGDVIKSATRGLLSLAGSFGDLLQERDAANYRMTLNEAIAEADKRMDEEVFSQEGFSAEGASEKAADIYAEVGGKYSGKLSGENARKFSEYWGSRRNSQANSVMRFERSQLQRAQLSANKTLIDHEVGNYGATLEPDALERAKSAYDDTVRLTNGGHLVNRETLDALRRDIQDNDGKVKLADGRTLKVVKDGEPTGRDAISESQLKEIEKRLEKRAEAYETGLQNLYDTAHAQVVERYLKDDRLNDATEYLNTVSIEGYPQGISKKVLTECREAVGRKQEMADISTEASNAISRIQGASGAESSKYGSESQDRLYAQFKRDITQKYSGEKWEKGQRILRMLDMQYRLLRDQQKATLTSDTITALTQIQKAGMTLAQQETFIGNMKDSPLKDALRKAHGRAVDSYNNSTDPVFLADQEKRLNAFKLALGIGRAELDGVYYDFRKPEELKAYVLNLGFTAKNQKRAAEYINNSRDRIDATLVAKVLADLLEIDDPAEALSRYPDLLSQLDGLKGSGVIEPSQMNTWLKANIPGLIARNVKNYNWFWPDTNAKDDGKSNDLYIEKEQLIRDWRRLNFNKAFQNNDRKGMSDALKANPTDKELEDFARTRGLRYDNGRYFLRGGK